MLYIQESDQLSLQSNDTHRAIFDQCEQITRKIEQISSSFDSWIRKLANLKDFKNPDEVRESCIKINSYENIADDVLSQAIVKLFETNDALLIIKQKSILDYLEIVTDKAEEVANIMESIVIKYA